MRFSRKALTSVGTSYRITRGIPTIETSGRSCRSTGPIRLDGRFPIPSENNEIRIRILACIQISDNLADRPLAGGHYVGYDSTMQFLFLLKQEGVIIGNASSGGIFSYTPFCNVIYNVSEGT